MVNFSRHCCPVCESKLGTGHLATFVLDTPRGKQEWARCPACRSFFACEEYDPEQEVIHTRTRPWGTAESGLVLNEEKRPMFDAVLRDLGRYCAPGTPLLDVGCSYGGFLLRAQEEGYEVRGIDIVPEAVEYVRGRGIPCDLAASVGGLDLPEDSLGVVTALDCNYYWPGQRKELRAIYSRLRPDGILAVRTVDTSWAIRIGLWLQRFSPGAGRRLCEKAVYDHRVSVPVGSLLDVVRREKFEIIHASPLDAMPFRHNSLKVKTAYAVGWLSWTLSGYNLSPGFVFLARKKAS